MLLLWLDAGMLMVGFVVFCCRDAASEVDGLMVVCLFSIDLHGRLIALFFFLSQGWFAPAALVSGSAVLCYAKGQCLWL